MSVPASNKNPEAIRFPRGVFSTREVQRDSARAPLRPRLVLDHDPEIDTLTAIDFGRVPFGQGDAGRLQLTADFAFRLAKCGGWPVGFQIDRFSSFTTVDLDQPERIEFLRFDAPLLALTSASADHIVLEARSQLAGSPTFARRLWWEILAEDQRLFGHRSEDEIEQLLRRILRSGDMTAHLGIGAKSLASGDFRRALTHLCAYTNLAPASKAGLELLAQAENEVGNSEAAYELEKLSADLEYEADRRIADAIAARSEA